eukprot:scaffold70254_cov24-Cyclotella_meneghiniana.AAC.1
MAFNSRYYPGVILEGESRSLWWPLAATLLALCSRRMKTPVLWLKCLGGVKLSFAQSTGAKNAAMGFFKSLVGTNVTIQIVPIYLTMRYSGALQSVPPG